MSHEGDARTPDLGSRYVYRRSIGRGGSGQVYLVRDRHLEKDVALKVFHSDRTIDGDFEELQREFTLLSRLEHARIARAHDFGYLGNQPFFTSEFIPGKDFARIGRLDDLEAFLCVARDLASAVAFLHRNAILHLDIKPSNLIAPSGAARGSAVLVDFGVCRRAASAPREVARGSLPFMGPEFFRGESLGPTSDVYAIGVSLYRLAAGRLPRESSYPEVQDPSGWDPAPASPSRWAKWLPRDLESIVLKCLALDPKARFGSAVELEDALSQACDTAPSMATTAVRRGVEHATLGREHELERIDRWLARWVDPTAVPATGPVALLITGAPGCGQSHLLRDVKARAQLRGLKFYLERGYPGWTTVPGALLRCLGMHDGGEPAARARWRRFLARLRRPRRRSMSEVTDAERRARWVGEVALAAALVSEPLVIAADGLQYYDEVSLHLFLDLVRFLAEAGAERKVPVGVIAAYREEGPSRPILRELTESLVVPGRAEAITLGPLGLEDAMELYSRRRGEPPSPAIAIELYQETGGIPARVVEAAAGDREGGASSPARGRSAAVMQRIEMGSRDERRLLVGMALLRRPASIPEVAKIFEVPAQSARRLLMRLHERGLIDPVEGGHLARKWVAASGVHRFVEDVPETERRRSHRRIARYLLRRGAAGDPTTRFEAVRHLQLAEASAQVVKFGLPAARRLKAMFLNRAALEVYRAVVAALPERKLAQRVDVELEMAELEMRLGELARGVDSLREFLATHRELPPGSRARVLLWIATLYCRQGEFRRAESLFREGFHIADELRRRGRRGELDRHEHLFFLNEMAAMAAFTARYGVARRLCGRGLALAARRRAVAVREIALTLHATRGNVALRQFDYPAAKEDFLRALEIADAIGSPADRAAILNNLGILHGNCDEYADAIRAFQEAEKASLRLDEGPSLVAIYGNLAVLHAKTGDFDAAEKVAAQAEALGPAAMGRRQELTLHHCRGLSLLYRGRFKAARGHLEMAVRLAREAGDTLLAAFGRAYRAESLLFEAAYVEAERDLEDLRGKESPPPVRRMALARLGLVAAWTGRARRVLEFEAQHDALAESRTVPFLDAWDDFFLGWALSVAGAYGEEPDLHAERARARLRRAGSFFEDHGLGPALACVRWVEAECWFLEGKREEARAALAATSPRNDLTKALAPLLEARTLLEHRYDRASIARCADLLAEAGAALAGNELPEWSARAVALRARLEASESGRLQRRARRAPGASRSVDGYSRAWLEVAPAHAPAEGRSREIGSGPAREPPTEELRAACDVSSHPGSAAGEGRGRAGERLVALSAAMGRLRRTLDRLRASDLPVLVLGETGCGKEVVARVIHEESRRAAGPFVVLDVASLPPGLVEVELFGAAAGAFTDQREERLGLLAAASGGTMLVDEVADLGLEVQAKLLRVLSTASFRPVGADHETSADVRFLFSTSRDLDQEAAEGRLRADFLHRIRVLELRVPPLRERKADIPLLADMFLGEGEGSVPELEPGVLERLREHSWPGNVRELGNLLARLRLEHPRCIPLAALAPLEPSEEPRMVSSELLAESPLGALTERLEREYLLYHLERLGGDTRELSRFLGIGRQQLYRRLRKLGVRLRPGSSDGSA